MTTQRIAQTSVNTKPIADVATSGLISFENNYLRLNKTQGGIYTLVEVRRELQRRQGGKHDGKTVYKTILALLSASATGYISYGQLFSKLHKVQWVGNGSQQLLNKDLGAVVYHCVQNNLPIITSLIISATARQLTDQAKQNIYDCAQRLGITNMPSSVDIFIDDQQNRSLLLVSSL